MTPETVNPEPKRKIPAGQTLLFAEPIFKLMHGTFSSMTEFRVPLGYESWIDSLKSRNLNENEIITRFIDEYVSIAHALNENDVPYRLVIAHRQALDEKATLMLMNHLGVRGVGLNPSISSTSFPRDILVDFDGDTHLNPEANVKSIPGSEKQSMLGEGGRVLKVGKKVFLPHPNGYVQSKQKFLREVDPLKKKYQIGFLPHPLATEVDIRTGRKHTFDNDHLDRSAAFIKGADEKDYLLVDSNYMSSFAPQFGRYSSQIISACRDLDVTLVDVKRKGDSIPNALNFVQFEDKSVVMTGGDNQLQNIVEEIVGQEKVVTTQSPIILYPLIRGGGIRCMTLFAPESIVQS